MIVICYAIDASTRCWCPMLLKHISMKGNGHLPQWTVSFDSLFFVVSMDISQKILLKQECILVGCVPPARYRTGGLPNRDPAPSAPPPPGHRAPWTKQRPTWTEIPDRDPQSCDLWSCWDRDPPPCVNRCKNITLPRTPFAGCNCLTYFIWSRHLMTVYRDFNIYFHMTS